MSINVGGLVYIETVDFFCGFQNCTLFLSFTSFRFEILAFACFEYRPGLVIEIALDHQEKFSGRVVRVFSVSPSSSASWYSDWI